MSEFRYRKGDIVEIIDFGEGYSSAVRYAVGMDIDDKFSTAFGRDLYDKSPKNIKGKILSMMLDGSNQNIYGIYLSKYDRNLIMGERGLKLIKSEETEKIKIHNSFKELIK